MIIIKYEDKNFLDLSEAEQEQIFMRGRKETVYVEDVNGDKFQVLDLTKGLEHE